jgi:hypothetical protein
MRVGIVLACGKHLNGSHDFTKREDLSHSPVLTTTTVIEVHIQIIADIMEKEKNI